MRLLLFFIGITLAPIYVSAELVDLKGWDHLYKILVRDGLDPSLALNLITDSRFPKNDPIIFNVRPREPSALYQRRNTGKERENALKFYRANSKYFEIAEEKYNVPSGIIAAVLQIETRCGQYTGRRQVFYQLARLASAGSEESIERSTKSNIGRNPTITSEQVVERALWLEQTFLPHVLATIDYAQKKGLDPLEVRGSSAGAIGLPQFLPKNYFLYGADGDGDGVVDLFSPADAIHSVAKFLNAHGWNEINLPNQKRREVLFHYNRSEPYVATVLAMGDRLQYLIERERRTNK